MNRGNVVEIDWQFSDRTGSKKRSRCLRNGPKDGMHVPWKITSSRFGIPGAEVALDPASSGVSVGASLRWSLLQGLPRDPTLMLRTVGVLSDAAMRQIDASEDGYPVAGCAAASEGTSLPEISKMCRSLARVQRGRPRFPARLARDANAAPVTPRRPRRRGCLAAIPSDRYQVPLSTVRPADEDQVEQAPLVAAFVKSS